MALKTSLVITGDAASAEAALSALDKGLGEASVEAQKLDKAFAAADKSIEKVAAAQARAKSETIAATVALKSGSISQTEYNTRLLETKTALSLVEVGHKDALQALKQAQASIGGATVSTRQAAAGYQNFGRQVQDVAVQLQGGANLGTIISQQGGQIADAVAMMGGRFAGIASFLAGPWGAAIIVASGLLVDLGVQFLKSGDDANEAKDKIFNLAGGLENLADNAAIARDAMDKLRQSLTQATPASDAADKATKTIITSGASLNKVNQEIAATNKLLQSPSLALGGADTGLALVNRLGQLEKQKASLQKSIKDARTDLDQVRATAAAADIQEANRDRLSQREKKQRTPRNKGDAAARAADRRIEFGEDTAKRIANIVDQFSDLPTAVGRANKSMRELDDISSDLAKRPLTPNVDQLIAKVGQAKNVIRESLNKPFNDYIEQAKQAAEIDKLLIAGREDEARALRVVLDLQKEQGPLQQEQLQAVLETERAQRQTALVLRDQRDLLDANISAVRDFRSSLVGTVADALRGRFSVDRVLASLGNSYVNIVSQKLIEGLFGDTLRKLEAQATGADKVDAAGIRIATSLDKGGKAVDDFAATVARANALLGKEGNPRGAADLTDGLSGVSNSISEFLGKLTSGVAEKVAQQANGNGIPEATGPEIVVTAEKARKVDLSGTGALLVDIVDRTMQQLGVRLPQVVTSGLKGVLGKLEQSLPQALQGAFTGSTASRIVLGDRGVGGSIGSAIGGALGGKVGEQLLGKGLTAIGGKLLGGFAGPIGSALGGVLGGLIGGAFKKTTSGGASIGLNAQGQGAVTGTAGNSADLKKTASGYGGTVVSALDQIAQALGADLGNFNVAIGKRSSGWIKVSASGNAAATTGKKVTSDIIYNGKDEGEALMAALANAIGDGAIKGISAAVQKALNSSTDVDKAVKEALKVQQVELAIGGVGAEMEKAFKDFERQAAERLRIARQYGFDVAKLEEVNAKDRLKLTERLMKEQVGSLQSLIEQLTSGSLFEGSAVDRRSAILSEISKTRDAANRGEEGAADKLAGLLEQLNSVSKEVYGTTGGFANDRATIIDQARETVAKANQRISDAQKGSDPALAATNAALDENNDQNAAIIAALAQSNALLAKLTGTKLNTSALAALARV